MDRAYILDQRAAVPLEQQVNAAVRHGFKRRDLDSEYGGSGVYIERKRGGEERGHWIARLIEDAKAGDVVHVYDLSVLGATEGVIAERLAAIGAKRATVKVMLTGVVVKPNADTVALLTAMREARQRIGKRRSRIMLSGKAKGAAKGGKRKEFTPEQIEACRAAWLLGKTQPEVRLLAKEALGRTVGYTTLFRWSKEFEWPARGSGPRPIPKKRRKRRKAKR